MKSTIRIAAVLAMIAVLLATTSSAGAQEDRPIEEAPALETTASLVKGRDIILYEPANHGSLRESLQLPQVSAERLTAESSRNSSVADYGEAMLDSEITEIEIRNSLLDETDKIREITAEIDGYGGMYLDHSTGQLVINLASSDIRQQMALQDQLRRSGLFSRGSENRVVVREVTHSMAELTAARETLRKDYGSNSVRATGFLEQDNRLWVVLDRTERQKDLSDAIDPILRDVPVDIPISVSFGMSGTEDACTSRKYCGGGSTRRAGIGVTLAGTTKGCTTGFAFKRTNGDEFLTTAGHCWYDNDSGTIRTRNGTHGSPPQPGGLWIGTLNNVNPYKYPGVWGVNCDCRLIQVSDSLTQNVLYKSDTAKWRTVTAKTLQVSTGAIVKMFGQKSYNQTQGIVAETSVDIDGRNWAKCGCWMYETTQASYPSQDGDSGGAVTANSVSRAIGIHSGTNSYQTESGQTVIRKRFFDVGLMEQSWNLDGVVMTTPN